jgi:hypothetical protein
MSNGCFLMRKHAAVVEYMKSQTPSTKPGPRPEGGDSEGEITNKSQIPMLNDQNRFGILNFGHCDLFDICNLRLFNILLFKLIK